MKMKIILFASCAVLCGVTTMAVAADRVRPGQWETTLSVLGQTITRPSCLSKADADAINGNEASIRAYAERVSQPAACKVKDVHIDGNTVSVTSMCASGKENVGKTTYHGDRYETVNTNGTKATAKLVGQCQ